jgi:hypothetical protein
MENALFYVIDTSALIKMKYDYPISKKKSLWEKCDELIDERRLGAPETVLIELKRRDDDLHKWAKERQSDLFYDESSCTECQQDIINKNEGLVDSRRQYEQADVAVIALARKRRSKPALTYTGVCVVTEEILPLPNPWRKRKTIPEVCNNYGLHCIQAEEMISREGWKI